MRLDTPRSRRILALLTLTLSTGCASRQGGPTVGAPSPVDSPAASPAAAVPRPTASCPLCLDADSPQLLAAYAAAVEASKYPTPAAISRHLTALTPWSEGLIWNDAGQVLLVTWTKAWYFDNPEIFSPGKPFSLAVDTWFTVAPFVQEFCRQLDLDGPMLSLRLEQLIGLPPGREKDAFVEMWVHPTDLFRPCPDPEISDHECQIEIPVVGRDHRRPWDCSLKEQVSGDFVTVHPGHLRWMCDNWTASFENDDPLDNYAWTALGYTYDWGHPDDPRGPSEYVALAGRQAVFHASTPTEEYCARE